MKLLRISSLLVIIGLLLAACGGGATAGVTCPPLGSGTENNAGMGSTHPGQPNTAETTKMPACEANPTAMPLPPELRAAPTPFYQSLPTLPPGNVWVQADALGSEPVAMSAALVAVLASRGGTLVLDSSWANVPVGVLDSVGQLSWTTVAKVSLAGMLFLDGGLTMKGLNEGTTRLDQPDGSIRWVDLASRTVRIELSANQRVDLQREFEGQQAQVPDVSNLEAVQQNQAQVVADAQSYGRLTADDVRTIDQEWSWVASRSHGATAKNQIGTESTLVEMELAQLAKWNGSLPSSSKVHLNFCLQAPLSNGRIVGDSYIAVLYVRPERMNFVAFRVTAIAQPIVQGMKTLVGVDGSTIGFAAKTVPQEVVASWIVSHRIQNGHAEVDPSLWMDTGDSWAWWDYVRQTKYRGGCWQIQEWVIPMGDLLH